MCVCVCVCVLDLKTEEERVVESILKRSSRK